MTYDSKAFTVKARDITGKLRDVPLHELLDAFHKQASDGVSVDVSKRYKFTFRDENGLLIIVNADTERKALQEAFRRYEIPKDRQLTIVSKEVNA